MMRARFFQPPDSPPWDAFCSRAYNATFLHTRRFLSYHGERFVDRSIVLSEGEEWIGLLPAAIHPSHPDVVVSHPGITYGGMLHQGRLRGSRMIEAFSECLRLLAAEGHRTLQYKAVPHIYHGAPASDDLYALFRLGARQYRCDLSSCIDLSARLPVSERRRRGLKKALHSGLRIASGPLHLEGLWSILEENLRRKHGVVPTHSRAEMAVLADRFPGNIGFHVALRDDRTLAGTVLFRCGPALHAQYIAVSEDGEQAHALDALFEHCIDQGRAAGFRFFDFGISTEAQGTVLNEGLYRFKSEFGASGVVHAFHELDTKETGHER